MQNNHKKACILTVIMVAVVSVLRVFITPRMMDADTGMFRLSYIVIAVMGLTIVALAALTGRRREPVKRIGGLWLKPAAVMAMLCGGVMVLCVLTDISIWLVWDKTPAPESSTSGMAEQVVLTLSLLFGVLGGAFLFRTGLLWLQENGSRQGVYKLWALCPVLWIWFRLARYEMSYVSAVDVYRSFYDFVMLIFVLLFFFGFARYISGFLAKPPRWMMTISLCTALFGITGPFTRLAMYMMGEEAAYKACQLAGPVDFAVGLFALCFAFSQAYGTAFPAEAPEQLPADEAEGITQDAEQGDIPEAEPEPPVAGEKPEEAEPTVEDILKDIYSSRQE